VRSSGDLLMTRLRPRLEVVNPPAHLVEVAQLVEHYLAKVEVAGSRPVFRSSVGTRGHGDGVNIAGSGVKATSQACD
jgi:hypothetical protein